jgi:hypothetical protein
MREIEAPRPSSSDIARLRATVRDVLPGVIGIVALQGSLVIVNPDGRASGWLLAWSLSPIVPALWLVFAQVRDFRRADELQRIFQLQAMAVAFAVTIVLALLGGLLDAARVGSARQSLQLVFIVGVLTWIAAMAILPRRSR